MTNVDQTDGYDFQTRSKLGADGKDFRKCPKHNMWKRKGECSMCYAETLKQLKQQELVTGSNKPVVKVGKV